MRAPAGVEKENAIRDEHRRDTRSGGQALLATGGIIAALGASSCCILPFLLFSLGISGAWIGNLTALAPYQPVFIAAAVGFLGLGFMRVYRVPKLACATNGSCTPSTSRAARLGLWVAAIIVAAAILFPRAAPLFLDL